MLQGTRQASHDNLPDKLPIWHQPTLFVILSIVLARHCGLTFYSPATSTAHLWNINARYDVGISHWCSWSPVSPKRQEFLGSNPNISGFFDLKKHKIQLRTTAYPGTPKTQRHGLSRQRHTQDTPTPPTSKGADMSSRFIYEGFYCWYEQGGLYNL